MALGPGGQIALQGGIDIGGGIIGNLFQKRNIRLQKEANMQLANYAYDKDKEMWNLQNLYNSPKAQMQRFAQAGLNPNLIYGKGTPGNAVAMPKRQQVQSGLRQTNVPTPNVLGMLQQYQNIENTKKEIQHKDELIQTQNAYQAIKEIDFQLGRMNLDWQQGPSKWTPGRNNFQAYMNKRNQMQQQTHLSQVQRYNLDAKKFKLLDYQIDNALWEARTKQRKYHWMPWEKGFNMGAKTVGTAVGAAGVRRFTKGTAPKLKKPSYSFRNNNRDIGPNYNF